MKNFLLSIVCLGSINCFGQQYSQSWTDVNYAGDGQVYHNMDIYLPQVQQDSYPVVIYIYGSAWFSNNSKGADLNTIGAALLDAGFAVVMPNHRSSSDAKFPAQINDIKAVVRFLRGNSAAYSLDTSFIGISGSSSGGHLAALTGTSRYVDDYTVGSETMDIEGEVGNFDSYSSSVDAVVDWFGPTDLLVMSSCVNGNGFDHDGPNSPGSNLIGGQIHNFPDRVALLNPITYADPTDPPFLIFHGDADNIVPYCQSELLHEALQSEGVSSEYILVPGGGHGPGVHTAQNIQTMVDFFLRERNNVVTSTGKKSSETLFSLYTNMSDGTLYVNGASQLSSPEYQILDVSGRKVAEGYLENNTADISSLKGGIYIFRLSLENGNTFSDRFIKSY